MILKTILKKDFKNGFFGKILEWQMKSKRRDKRKLLGIKRKHNDK